MAFEFALFQEWMESFRQTWVDHPWSKCRDEDLWGSLTGTYGLPFVPGTPPIRPEVEKPRSRVIYPDWFDVEFFVFADQILQGKESAPADVSPSGLINAIMEWMMRTDRPQWKIMQETGSQTTSRQRPGHYQGQPQSNKATPLPGGFEDQRPIY
ncbi:MAG: hypothetical protein HQL67_10965 [Magnetococcales bacterium]|nr:hypothetical protein [Magnetococcales bacterium]